MYFASIWILYSLYVPLCQQHAENDRAVENDIKIQINYENEEWKDVCTFVAEQFGYSLSAAESGFPKGTFTYTDFGENSLSEVLDKLNLQMSLLQPPYTIVRKQRHLYVIPEDEIENHLIENRVESDLNNFGDQEVVLCSFSLNTMRDITALQVVNEIRQEIEQNPLSGFSYFQSSQTLQIRERVVTLKRLASLVKRAVQFEEARRQQLEMLSTSTTDPVAALNLKHVSPHEAVTKINELIKNEPVLSSISVVADEDHQRLLTLGKPEQIRIVQSITELLDVPNNTSSHSKSQRVFIDREQLNKIIDKVLHTPSNADYSTKNHVQLIVPVKRTESHPK